MLYKLSEVQKGNGAAGEAGPASRTPRALTCDCGLDNFLPRWTHWAVAILTLFVRIYYIGQPQSFWILHPDEIYQTVEGKWGRGGVEWSNRARYS